MKFIDINYLVIKIQFMFLEKKNCEIYWSALSFKESIFVLDYDFFHREELMKKWFHPNHQSRYLEMGYHLDLFDDSVKIIKFHPFCKKRSRIPKLHPSRYR